MYVYIGEKSCKKYKYDEKSECNNLCRRQLFPKTQHVINYKVKSKDREEKAQQHIM